MTFHAGLSRAIRIRCLSHEDNSEHRSWISGLQLAISSIAIALVCCGCDLTIHHAKDSRPVEEHTPHWLVEQRVSTKLLEFRANPSLIEAWVDSVPVEYRREFLNRPYAWRYAFFEDIWSSIAGWMIVVAIALMGLAHRLGQERHWPGESINPHPNRGVRNHNIIDRKQQFFSGLLKRDFGPLSFDVGMNQDRADINEYRGLLHWFRDVIEKALSIALVVFFAFFLARLVYYLWEFSNGQGWKLAFIVLDINIALTACGFALIADGFIHIACMTDAPGISRTLDSLIVILVGFIVMTLEARPAPYAAISFGFGEDGATLPWVCLVIAILFLARWLVRNHTWNGFIGPRENR